MKHFFALTLLLSFNAFAGQEGNGPVLEVSPTERRACIFLAQEMEIGTPSDFFVFEHGGETHYFSREELTKKCCAVGAMTCSILGK